MGALDYFLHKKWDFHRKNLKSNERYTALALEKDNNLGNPNFALVPRLESDRYLFDYLRSFANFAPNSRALKEALRLETLGLLLISKELEETNPHKLIKIIEELSAGRHPKNQDEIKIMNLLEVLALIETEHFEITRENYDVVVHLLFRNLGFDIEDKSRFYRLEKTKTLIPSVLPVSKIDESLNFFIDYLTKLNDQNVSGFTQSIVILVTFIYLSPYQKNNLLLAFLMSKWYLQTLTNQPFVQPIHRVVYDWKKFLKLLDKTYTETFDLDEILAFFSAEIINGANDLYRLALFNNWIANDPSYNHIGDYMLPNLVDKMVALRLIDYAQKGLRVGKLESYFRIVNQKVFPLQELLDILQRLIDQEILEERANSSNGSKILDLKNSYLYKLQRLLKDQEI